VGVPYRSRQQAQTALSSRACRPCRRPQASSPATCRNGRHRPNSNARSPRPGSAGVRRDFRGCPRTPSVARSLMIRRASRRDSGDWARPPCVARSLTIRRTSRRDSLWNATGLPGGMLRSPLQDGRPLPPQCHRRVPSGCGGMLRFPALLNRALGRAWKNTR
jgi:hypothetical protein